MTTKNKPLRSPKARLSYPHLFEPKAMKNSNKEKYSATLIFDKDTDLKELKKAALKQGKEKFPTAFKDAKKWPKSIKNPFLSGDELAEKAEEEGKTADELKGKTVIRISTDFAPEVAKLEDGKLSPVLERKDIYAGCFVMASLNVYDWSVETGKGISFGLNNICKIADGDPLGGVGGSSAEDDFGDLGEVAGTDTDGDSDDGDDESIFDED